jgi:3D (Asp-Asp-Asp) domain-containing protein
MLLRMALLTVIACFVSACGRSLPPYEKPIARANFQHVRTTAYTHTESDHLEHGCLTCMGTQLRCGVVNSAAADWSRWPRGTVFRVIDTGEVYEVEDIGWALAGRNTIDLYKPTKGAMNQWGARNVNIEILQWGEDRESLSALSRRAKYAHVKRMVVDLEKRVARGATNPAPSGAIVANEPPVAAVTARTASTLPAASTPAAAPRVGGLRRRDPASL